MLMDREGDASSGSFDALEPPWDCRNGTSNSRQWRYCLLKAGEYITVVLSVRKKGCNEQKLGRGESM